ncbi:MAG: S8 family peptidase [Bacteriovorax sp.]|nr:S8 family peptidase [Bacteriovorax sp.]
MKLSYTVTIRQFVTTVFLLSLTILSANATSPEAKFDGYIIKLKKGHGFMPLNGFRSLGDLTELSVDFGDYYHLNSANSFSEIDLNAIKTNPDVEYIEPNYLYTHLDHGGAVQPASIQDPLFKSQWSLFNTGHNTWIPNSPPGIDVNAVKGWEIAKGGSDVVIAIIDSGIDYNHPDLKKNLWINEAEKNGKPGVDDDGNGFIDDIYGYDFANEDGDPMDGLGHGTHVAGIIGASHNGEGIRGVMNNVKIMSLKFLTDKGPGDTKNAIRAVDYAIKNGAQIINNSWGGGDYSQAMYDAFMAAAEKNIIITAAAGNSNVDNDVTPKYPASYKVPNLITVAAHNALEGRASFSNYGKNSVSIYAPGLDIVSTDLKSNYIWSTGTSVATPIITGALGLLLSMEPGISYTEAKNRLMETSIKTPELLKYAQAGRLDIYRLLTNLRN